MDSVVDVSGPEGGRSARLYAVARALAAARTPAEVADAVFRGALSDLGASTVGLWLVGDEVITLAGGAGLIDDAPVRLRGVPLGSDLPAAVAVRSREAVVYSSTAERDRRWPALRGVVSSGEAVAVLPLPAGDRVLGVLHVGFPAPLDAEQMGLAVLTDLAGLCAAALERTQVFEREQAHAELLQFLAEATRVLAGSLEPGEVLEALAAMAVSALAMWCAVYLPREGHLVAEVTRLVTAPGSGVLTRPIPGVLYEPLVITGPSPTATSFRTRSTVVMDPLTGLLSERRGPQVAAAVAATGLRSAISAPILWDGEAIGVLCLGFPEEGTARRPDVIDRVEGLALRAGLALHNASRYDEQRSAAALLTRALLPTRPPAVDGYEVAARYLPAGAAVAGDWYDVCRVGERVLVGVGDAAGHGLPAATLMAELRFGARAVALAGAAPPAILAALSELTGLRGTDDFATAAYGLLDPAGHTFAWSIAGHPSPLLVRAGRVRALGAGALAAGDAGVPLGVGHSSYPQHVEVIEAGDTVVFITDGVIERRGVDLDISAAELAGVVADLADRPSDELVDGVITALCADAVDDCLVLALRRLQ